MSTETKALIGILVATVLIIAGGAWLSGRSGPSAAGEPVANPEQLVREDDPILGAADAQVTVVEFGDFECPSCGAVHPLLKTIKQQYADRSVRFVYRHFPLPQHEHAQDAAEAAVEAQRQGKFWEYHDLLFEHQTALDRASLEQYATQVGLDMDAFRSALTNHAHADAVAQDRSDGQAVNITGTPSIFINTVPYSGAYSVEGLSTAIDAALAQATPAAQ